MNEEMSYLRRVVYRRKADIYFVLALACYAFPAVAVLFKQEAGWILSNVAPHSYIFDNHRYTYDFAYLPFSQMAMFTDRYLPAFYAMAVPALWLFLSSFNALSLRPPFKTLLQFIAVLVIFFAIPSLTWPIGSTYYETLDFYMGQLSLIGAFFLLFFFMLWRGKG
jgi:hypothetical protein